MTSQPAVSDDDTERIKVECGLCQGAGCFLSGHLCEACGGYGTVYRSVDTFSNPEGDLL